MICSTTQTATATITAVGRRHLMGATLYGAAADALLKIHNCDLDSEDANGNELLRIGIDVSLEGNTSTKTVMFPEGIQCTDGIFCKLTGAGAEYLIYYK